MSDDTPTGPAPRKDAFGRPISYLRLSVTDRCDLRCTYCMAERPGFLPKKDLLTFEELEAVAAAFIRRGVDKIRITGGEPLVRKGIGGLFRRLAPYLDGGGLRELTMTTNATRLEHFAGDLAACGVRRVNVSLDSLDPHTYAQITRGGRLENAVRGIRAAAEAGIACKINVVALKDQNAEEIPSLVEWAHGHGHDISLIEVMPTADTGHDRRLQFLPLSAVRDQLDQRWTLTPSAHRTAGPARYWDIRETGGRLGLITPLTENFCAGCNRVRVTSTGRLVLCLGREDGVDLRAALRGRGDLDAAIERGLGIKPERHDFERAYLAGKASVSRSMSTTGG